LSTPIKPSANIEAVFTFLERNNKYNKKIQESEIRRILGSYDAIEDRARYLLHEIYNTQSQPKLEPAADFFKNIFKQSGALATFDSFSRCLDLKSKYKGDLFRSLVDCNGWGHKTSALFIRNLALIRNNDHLRSMFWEDIASLDEQPIRLPVDAVITAIFERLQVTDSSSRPVNNFSRINNYLMERYTREEMLIWDDLWFWGFITQRSEPKNPQRIFGFNEAKYWSIFTAPKEEPEISKIKRLTEDFLSKIVSA
jgi:hypothetical protein